MDFNTWIDTYIDEKGLDPEQFLNVQGPSGENQIPVGTIVDQIKEAPGDEQRQIKDILVAIDFQNGSPLHFLRHLAQAIAV